MQCRDRQSQTVGLTGYDNHDVQDSVFGCFRGGPGKCSGREMYKRIKEVQKRAIGRVVISGGAHVGKFAILNQLDRRLTESPARFGNGQRGHLAEMILGLN